MHTLAFLQPGHFHAALTLREAHPLLNEEIVVYATPGAELDAFMALVEAFNARAGEPTRWRPEVYRGEAPLERLISEGRADAVVLAGRNDCKMANMRRLHEAGCAVLADKPWVTGPRQLAHLEAVTTGAGPLLMDIMTSRHEITAVLQRRLVAEEAIFGGFREGGPDAPAIEMESVHHLYKTVNGVPLVRPDWYFDIAVQGDGVVDVPTHLVDLVQWIVGQGTAGQGERGESPFDYQQDVTLHGARRWATAVPPERFAQITGSPAFPAHLAPRVRDGTLRLLCNGEFHYALRGLGVRIHSVWNLETPPGGGDTKRARLRGNRADIVLEQERDTGFVARLSVHPRGDGQGGARELEGALQGAVARWARELPGLAAVPHGARESDDRGGWELVIPPTLRTGHETHFALVLDAFLRHLQAGTRPAGEAANQRAKYTLLARASALAAAPS